MTCKTFMPISRQLPTRTASLTRVLGVDPGLTRCGFAVVDSGPVAVEYGVIRTPADWSLADRIHFIASEAQRLIAAFRPELLAIEEVFAQQNLKSVMSVAQVSGALIYLAKQADMQVQLVTPTAVKLAVTGSGGSDKSSVANMIVRHYKLAEPPKPADVADALAVAYAAIQKLGTPARLRWVEAEQKARR